MPATTPSQPARQPFLIAAFVNNSGQRTLDFMQGGLPALIAERLEIAPALRFVGKSAMLERGSERDPRGSIDEVLSRATAAGARWVVAGQFEKRRDWKIAVAVEIYDVSAPSVVAGTSRAPAGRGQAVGTKEEVARTALRAALDALGSAGVTPAPDDAQRAAIVAPFARDPYAFVLYGRGVSAYVGIDGYGVSAGRAERNLVRALVIDPKIPEARRYLGLLHLGAGRPAQARAMWSHAIELRPSYTLALAGLAALDRTAGLPSARERYARVLELDPDDLDARRAYGELLSDAGVLPEAEAQLQAVVKARPGDLRARRALALVLASQQAGAALADELAEVVRLDPEDIDARFELAAAYNGPGVGKADLAVAAYEEILRRRPRHPVALKLLGDLLRRRGEAERAAGYYERLRRLSPEDPRPLFLLGTAYVEAGKLAAAERMFTEAARLPGMLGDAYANLGAIAYKRGQVKEALWFLSRAAKRRPGKPGVRFNYALALEAAARHADALTELEAAAGAAPDDAEIWFLSGVVALRMGKTQDAEAHFRQAVRVDPGHEKARHNLALLESLRSPGAEGSFTLVK